MLYIGVRKMGAGLGVHLWSGNKLWINVAKRDLGKGIKSLILDNTIVAFTGYF